MKGKNPHEFEDNNRYAAEEWSRKENKYVECMSTRHVHEKETHMK